MPTQKISTVARVYYIVKPLLPRWFQILLRRRLVKKKRRQHADVWPINHNAATPPNNWRGWPDGKKFAVVLTHDVEKALGYSRVPDLVAIEERQGFVSSFNMVPRRYDATPDIREMLVRKGFEVGVHGLYHDGKLFSSIETFRERAAIINDYIAEWNAAGFRAPAMHHNLDWQYHLNIEYDASTFDTDPFEPQSDGIGRIFPLTINACQEVNGECSCRQYVELPYTLVQDFSLFILLGEKTIDIWKQKVDWIAENGGMVLVNVHPDYMYFGKGKRRIEEFPARYYEDLLIYLKEMYGGQYWHVLPHDMARFWKGFDTGAANMAGTCREPRP